MLGNRIAVESVNKTKNENSLLVMPDTSNTGIIKYIGEDYDGTLKLGQKVCYGTTIHKARIAGQDLIVMDPVNVFAILGSESKGEKQD